MDQRENADTLLQLQMAVPAIYWFDFGTTLEVGHLFKQIQSYGNIYEGIYSLSYTAVAPAAAALYLRVELYRPLGLLFK